ncbi:unnamed protein product [Phaedon cochleariae]|nr:unnamed protein product [Phaedon cochleariae]
MPYGFGQLTNKGKLTAFKVGQELRKRYKGFLDETYNIKLIDARSSDFNRTKASLQAILAGLFPPTKELVWLEGMNWQPIATTYLERKSDKELFCFGCPSWKPNAHDFEQSEKGRNALIKDYKSISKFLTNKTGKTYSKLRDICSLYRGFQILESFNQPLPEWSKSIYPDKMKDIIAINYYYLVATPILRQMSAGFLLKKILDDTDDKINGRLPMKKMSILCGHEFNIASLLRVLDICEDYKSVPPYGSYILFELHRIDNGFGFKIFYQNYKTSEPKLMKLPKCEEFCSLKKFNGILKEDIPINDEVCTPMSIEQRSTVSRNYPQRNLIIIMSLSFPAFIKSSRFF